MDTCRRFSEDFHAAHDRLYGYADPKRALELVNVRLRGHGVTDKPVLGESGMFQGCPGMPIATHTLYSSGGMTEVPVFDRTTLGGGAWFTGPALAVDEGSTTFVTSGWHARVDGMGNLILTRTGAAL
jgi:N-methylhydantoinase A